MSFLFFMKEWLVRVKSSIHLLTLFSSSYYISEHHIVLTGFALQQLTPFLPPTARLESSLLGRGKKKQNKTVLPKCYPINFIMVDQQHIKAGEHLLNDTHLSDAGLFFYTFISMEGGRGKNKERETKTNPNSSPFECEHSTA